MRKFIKLIKEKWLKQTSLTILLVAIIVFVFAMVNMLFDKLDITNIDFTKEKVYSLSDESKEQVKDIEQNVTLYFFGYEEEATPVVLGKQYGKVNDKITAQIVTSTERPDLAAEYGITSDAQLVVAASSQRYKAVDASEMYTYDQTTYETVDITEQKLTNAILDVTIVSKPKIYFLTGHGEYGIGESSELYVLAQYIVNDVNDVDTLDLLSADMPEKCDALIIANPIKDFTDMETDKINTYINNGGKIIWLQDPYINITNYNKADFKNIDSILSKFGISFSSGIVFEQSTDNMIAGNPDLIIPELTYNEIVKDIYTDGNIVMVDAGKINTVSSEELENLGVTADAFVKSTDSSYYKEEFNSLTGYLKSDEDEEGSFVLGEILTKKIDDEKNATLIAYSSAWFGTNTIIPLGNSAIVPISLRYNKDILLNSVAYLTNREDSIRIRKDMGVVNFENPTATQDLIVQFIIYAVPLAFVLAGIIVTFIRRRRK